MIDITLKALALTALASIAIGAVRRRGRAFSWRAARVSPSDVGCHQNFRLS
jgi:hypothetical protein